ncbi:MAG: SUMF1/EgtB/PvdO family nonheme iron enzyme, partial [Myxococcota bacterium]|nr:SUMF1/EgtB/PvdO family nonheme iron enzyme [Myxococcota bacterium]
GPAVLLLTAVPLLTFPLVPLSHMVSPRPYSEWRTPPEMGVVDEGSRLLLTLNHRDGFSIDRYEAPNQVGVTPTTGASPAEADAMCRARGMRLCASRDWYEACSNFGRSFYSAPSYPYERAALSRLRRECNLHDEARAKGLQPSGALPRCKSVAGVVDMTGNAYEWVRMGHLDGFWGLAGSYHGYSDAQTPACGFRVLIHEAQLDIIDRGATGSRCCR